jgi:hypothetical protein
MGSDHLPIITSICWRNPNPPQPSHSKQRRIHKKADWEKYTHSIGSKLNQEINSYEDFEKILQDSADEAIPRNKNKKETFTPKHPYKTWWNESCTEAINNRKEATKNFRRLGNLQNFLELKRQTAIARNIIRKTKKEAFKNLCSSISRQTPITLVWDKVKSFNKGLTRTPCDPSGKLNIEEYADYLCPPAVPFSEETIPPIIQNDPDEELHQPFSMEELKTALNQTKDSTTGQDDISYSMLKHLPSEATENS